MTILVDARSRAPAWVLVCTRYSRLAQRTAVMDSGIYGEIWLAVVMVTGGAAGSVWLLVQARTREVRRFLIPRLFFLWLSIIATVVLTYMTPRPFSFLVWLFALVTIGSIAVAWWWRFWALNCAEEERNGGVDQLG